VSVSDLYIPRIGPHIFPCSRIGRLILEIYKSLTDTVCECRNRETEHYNSVLEMVGCLRAVIGIKIRDVRGLGVTQIGVGGGAGLGVGNEELKGRNRRGWRPLLKYASWLVFYICEPYRCGPENQIKSLLTHSLIFISGWLM
jgi:hypothetical protein